VGVDKKEKYIQAMRVWGLGLLVLSSGDGRLDQDVIPLDQKLVEEELCAASASPLVKKMKKTDFLFLISVLLCVLWQKDEWGQPKVTYTDMTTRIASTSLLHELLYIHYTFLDNATEKVYNSLPTSATTPMS